MHIKRERLPVRVHPKAEMALWDDLRQDFRGFVHEVKAQYWRTLHLPFQESGEPVPGEVFFADPDILMYYAIDPKREWVEAGCVLPKGEGSQVFEGFCERIRENLTPGLRETGPTWRPHVERNPAFELVMEEAQRLAHSPEQQAGAAALASPERRQMLRRIFSQGSCLLDSLGNGRSPMEVGQEVQLLENLGLVQKDFVVFCREGGNQISRVGSFSMIEDATKRGFKCFSCGRPIAEERIDQLLACTAVGSMLARPNYWLGLLLAGTLERMGIQRSEMLLVPGSHGVLDLFVNEDGALVMFEVKEEAVRLDDVFLFFSRIKYYGPSAAFFVTTQRVPAEVRKYMEGAAEVPVTLIEDLAGLEAEVLKVIFRAQRDYLSRVVKDLEPFTSVDVGELVYEYFFGKEMVMQEILESAGEKVAEEPAMPSTASEQAPVEAAEPAGGQPDERATAEAPSVEDASDFVPVETTPTFAEPPEMSEMGFQEELLEPPMEDMQEVLDVDDLGPMERPFDERREQLLRRIVDDVTSGGVLGRGEALEALLAEVSSLASHSAALVDENGLLLADALSDKASSEMTAAMAAEIKDVVQRGLDELGFGTLSHIHVDSQRDRLTLRTAGHGTLLVVREERAPREVEEESAGALPGEMVLREAMLKKVLEDLSMVEGIRGNIVAGRDGLLIESLLDEGDVPPDVQSIVLSVMLTDNERSLLRLQLYPVRQMLVRSSEMLFSLIPLDKEGILITLLDPGTPREVWQNRLYAASNMLTSVFQ